MSSSTALTELLALSSKQLVIKLRYHPCKQSDGWLLLDHLGHGVDASHIARAAAGNDRIRVSSCGRWVWVSDSKASALASASLKSTCTSLSAVAGPCHSRPTYRPPLRSYPKPSVVLRRAAQKTTTTSRETDALAICNTRSATRVVGLAPSLESPGGFRPTPLRSYLPDTDAPRATSRSRSPRGPRGTRHTFVAYRCPRTFLFEDRTPGHLSHRLFSASLCLSKTLRFDESGQFSYDAMGFFSLYQLRSHPRSPLFNYCLSERDVREIVSSCPKRRFQLRSVGDLYEIRACQGHSARMDRLVDLRAFGPWLPLDLLPRHLYHATQRCRLTSIFDRGLDARDRLHIHFLELDPVSAEPRDVRRGADVFLRISAKQAFHMGVRFHLSPNGYYLTRGDSCGVVPGRILSVV